MNNGIANSKPTPPGHRPPTRPPNSGGCNAGCILRFWPKTRVSGQNLIKDILRWFLRLLAIAFHDHFVARFGKQAEVFGSSVYGARFRAVGAVGQPVVGDALIEKFPQFAGGARPARSAPPRRRSRPRAAPHRTSFPRG